VDDIDDIPHLLCQHYREYGSLVTVLTHNKNTDKFNRKSHDGR